ncbi:MAG: radical SAM protein [Thermoanaerobaculia bacterium]|nr:radical SAM protein [Thermoanaerobaculia bacterium]
MGDLLNRATSPRLPFAWTINPYRGCEMGCAYCYARYTHGFLDLPGWREFETRIFVKRGAAAALRRQLRRRVLQGQPIAIGTVTDPYQPAESRFRVTRSLLELFATASGLHLAITTKSPLVLRDLDLLAELDRRHHVEVSFSFTTLDPRLARSLEPHAPAPRARLAAVERLAAAGLAVNFFCQPLLPGFHEEEKELRPLFEAARASGARDVVASPLFLASPAKERFFAWLAEERPDLLPRYRQLYGRRARLATAAAERLLVPFRRLRLAHGFPRPIPGRA